MMLWYSKCLPSWYQKRDLLTRHQTPPAADLFLLLQMVLRGENHSLLLHPDFSVETTTLQSGRLFRAVKTALSHCAWNTRLGPALCSLPWASTEERRVKTVQIPGKSPRSVRLKAEMMLMFWFTGLRASSCGRLRTSSSAHSQQMQPSGTCTYHGLKQDKNNCYNFVLDFFFHAGIPLKIFRYVFKTG